MFSRFPWYAWPLASLIEILTQVLFATLHFFWTMLGLSLILLGLFLTGTIIGAWIGLPLIYAGIAIRYHYKFLM
jgi:hypothetical protein